VEQDIFVCHVLHDELHSLYSSPNIVRVIKARRVRWAGHGTRVRGGEGERCLQGLVGRPEGKRPLGRSRRRWEDNIKLDLREVGIDAANWIQLTRNRVQWRVLVNTVMNLRVLQRKDFFDKLSDNLLFK
jgi:hypothetical protein